MYYVYLYAIALPIFLILDVLWLSLVAVNLFRTYVGSLLSPTVFLPPAIALYLLFVIGIVVFAVVPALEVRSITRAVALGALFGFLAYACYDLTNWATLKEWSVWITLVDMLWGTFLSGVVAGATYLIAMYFGLK